MKSRNADFIAGAEVGDHLLAEIPLKVWGRITGLRRVADRRCATIEIVGQGWSMDVDLREPLTSREGFPVSVKVWSPGLSVPLHDHEHRYAVSYLERLG